MLVVLGVGRPRLVHGVRISSQRTMSDRPHIVDIASAVLQ